MDMQEKINHLIKLGYSPYALTITFKQSWSQQEIFPDYLIYGYYENNYQDFEKVDYRARMIEKSFLKMLNLFSEQLLGTSHINRPNHYKRLPIIFYYMELMDRKVRQEMLENVSGGVHICPLHYHALVLAHPSTINQINEFVGDETLQRIFSINRLASGPGKRLQDSRSNQEKVGGKFFGIQHSQLKPCDSEKSVTSMSLAVSTVSVNRWHNYIRKDMPARVNVSFYAGYSGIFPRRFREHPDEYLFPSCQNMSQPCALVQ